MIVVEPKNCSRVEDVVVKIITELEDKGVVEVRVSTVEVDIFSIGIRLNPKISDKITTKI
ncbi:MAG: hypothetical protein C4278_02015 [Patescibacteria group bacterium]